MTEITPESVFEITHFQWRVSAILTQIFREVVKNKIISSEMFIFFTTRGDFTKNCWNSPLKAIYLENAFRYNFCYCALYAQFGTFNQRSIYRAWYKVQISRNIELFPEIPFKFGTLKSSGVRVIESRCGPECCNGRN